MKNPVFTPPPIELSLRRQIDAALAASRRRVVSIEHAGRRLWVKRAVRGKGRAVHVVQRTLSTLVPLRLLRYTGDVHGAAALAHEARVIERLRARGAHVPRVVARCDEWLVLEDIGRSLDRALQDAGDAQEVRRLAGVGAWALIALHRSGGWHGNPQARNLVIDGDRAGFLDFEEDVGSRLGVEAAQTRDWILFLSSLHRFEQAHGGLLSALMREIEGSLPQATRRTLLKLSVACGPLAVLLKPCKRWLGRDVRQALSVWEATQEVAPLQRRRLQLMLRVGAAISALILAYSTQVD